MLWNLLRTRKKSEPLTAAEKFRRTQHAIEERLVTYIIRFAVQRGSQLTSNYLQLYAEELNKPDSEVNYLVSELQEELDGLLGQSVNNSE